MNWKLRIDQKNGYGRCTSVFIADFEQVLGQGLHSFEKICNTTVSKILEKFLMITCGRIQLDL